eukprot:gb/GECG01008527.1/.p1 GENE.gb/GECG01008527.1/~~gb/GECG01008527.1/.p1  ORF type:complete len:491 (+),score=82.70 gb/GECG01008527.1/:1-1473(+)
MIYAAASSKSKLLLGGLPRNIETPQVAALAVVRALNGDKPPAATETGAYAKAALETPNLSGLTDTTTDAATTTTAAQSSTESTNAVSTTDASDSHTKETTTTRNLGEVNRVLREKLKEESGIPSTWNLNLLYLTPGKIRRDGEYVYTKAYLECRTCYADEVVRMLEGVLISEDLVSMCVNELYSEQVKETEDTNKESTVCNKQAEDAEQSTAGTEPGGPEGTSVVDVENLSQNARKGKNVTCETRVRWALNQRVPRQGDPLHLGQTERAGGRRPRKDALEGAVEKCDLYSEFMKHWQEKGQKSEMIGKRVSATTRQEEVAAGNSEGEPTTEASQKSLPALLEYLQVKAEKKHDEKLSKKPAKAPPAPEQSKTGKPRRIKKSSAKPESAKDNPHNNQRVSVKNGAHKAVAKSQTETGPRSGGGGGSSDKKPPGQRPESTGHKNPRKEDSRSNATAVSKGDAQSKTVEGSRSSKAKGPQPSKAKGKNGVTVV